MANITWSFGSALNWTVHGTSQIDVVPHRCRATPALLPRGSASPPRSTGWTEPAPGGGRRTGPASATWPASAPGAVVCVFAAQMVHWHGILAVYCWIVFKPDGVGRYTRYDYAAWGDPICLNGLDRDGHQAARGEAAGARPIGIARARRPGAGTGRDGRRLTLQPGAGGWNRGIVSSAVPCRRWPYGHRSNSTQRPQAGFRKKQQCWPCSISTS